MSRPLVDAKFLDDDGNMNPNSTAGSMGNENPTTINVAKSFVIEKVFGLIPTEVYWLKGKIRSKWTTNGGKYMTNDYDIKNIGKPGHHDPDSFSLDEMMSAAAASKRYGHKENLKKVRVLTKQTWYRFYDVVPFLLLCKYEEILYVLFGALGAGAMYLTGDIKCLNINVIPLYLRALVSLSMFVACLQERGDTSGKQLTFIRYMGLRMHITWWICKKILTNKDFNEVFQIWYPERFYPINVWLRQLKKQGKEL